jgi:hypothetical protein
MVAHIDANLPVRRGDCDVAQQRDWDALESAITGAGMMCVNREAWGAHRGMWSYKGGAKDGMESTSWIDWTCVSRHMWEDGIVTGMWMVDEALAGSDHRGLILDIDVVGALGDIDIWEKEGEGDGRRLCRILDAHTEKDVHEWGHNMGWESRQRVWESRAGAIAGEAAIAASEESQQGWIASANELMDEITKVAVEHEIALGKDRQGQWDRQSKRKGWSPEMVALAVQYRGARRLLRWYRRDRVKNWDRMIEERGRMVVQGGSVPPIPSRSREGATYPTDTAWKRDWAVWVKKVVEVRDVSKSGLHGKERRRDRQLMSVRVAIRDAEREEGRVGRIINSVLKRDKGVELVGRLVRDQGRGEVEVVTKKEEVERVTIDHFEKWFGKGRDKRHL